MLGLSVGRGCVAAVWARSLTGSGLLTLRGVVLALVRRLGVSARFHHHYINSKSPLFIHHSNFEISSSEVDTTPLVT